MTPFMGVRISWQQFAFLPAQHFHLELHEIDHGDHTFVFAGLRGHDDIVKAALRQAALEVFLGLEKAEGDIDDGGLVQGDDEGYGNISGIGGDRTENHPGNAQLSEHFVGKKRLAKLGAQRCGEHPETHQAD